MPTATAPFTLTAAQAAVVDRTIHVFDTEPARREDYLRLSDVFDRERLDLAIALMRCEDAVPAGTPLAQLGLAIWERVHGHRFEAPTEADGLRCSCCAIRRPITIDYPDGFGLGEWYHLGDETAAEVRHVHVEERMTSCDGASGHDRIVRISDYDQSTVAGRCTLMPYVEAGARLPRRATFDDLWRYTVRRLIPTHGQAPQIDLRPDHGWLSLNQPHDEGHRSIVARVCDSLDCGEDPHHHRTDD